MLSGQNPAFKLEIDTGNLEVDIQQTNCLYSFSPACETDHSELIRTMTPLANRNIRQEGLYLLCEWLASFALFLLAVFFFLFCAVLFSVWYFGTVGWWLATESIFLIAGMSLTAGMFGIASARLPPGAD